MKKTVRLTESDLKNIIKEAICELGDTGSGQRALGALHARKVLNVPGENKEEYLSNFKKTKDYYDYAAKARGGDDYDNTGRNTNPLYDVYAKGYIDYLKSHPEEYLKTKEKTDNLGINESRLKTIVKESINNILKESYDTDEQWKHEAQLFMRGLRNGKAVVEDDIAYVRIFKKDMAENDPRHVYIRKGDNRLHDDHFYIQDSPVLSKKTLNIIYNRLGWSHDEEEF